MGSGDALSDVCRYVPHPYNLYHMVMYYMQAGFFSSFSQNSSDKCDQVPSYNPDQNRFEEP